LKGTSGRNFHFFDFRLAFFAGRTLDFFAVFLDFLAADFLAAFFVVFVTAFFADAYFAVFADSLAVRLAAFLAGVFCAFFEVGFFLGGITTNGGNMDS
jgi:hypothetical protein